MKLSASQLRMSAKNWRGLVFLVMAVGLLLVLILSIMVAQVVNFFSGEEQLDGGVFLVTFLTYAIPVVGIGLPYLMMTQTMDGLATALDTLSTPKQPRRPRSAQRAAAARPHTSAPPVPRSFKGEPSVTVRRVAGAVGAIGDATPRAVAEKLGISISEVTDSLFELVGREMVTKLPDGRYRYIDPSQPAKPQMRYCATCRQSVTESVAAKAHAGHEVRW